MGLCVGEEDAELRGNTGYEVCEKDERSDGKGCTV